MIDRELLDRVQRPLADAHGLPNACFTDPALFALEQRKVLAANWSGIGFAKDIPNPGDAKPIPFLGTPLLAVRGRDSQVRVFQNTCRHRGMILVEQACNVGGSIRCPYHFWAYGLDGALRSTPNIGGHGVNSHAGIDASQLGLAEVRSAVWRDVIFVNVSGSAPPFGEYAQHLSHRWAAFEQPVHAGGPESTFTLDVRTNWKLAVENYADSGHLPYIHPSLNTYSRLEDHYPIYLDGPNTGQGTTVYRQLEGENGAAFPDFAGVAGDWLEAAEYVCLFPNVLLGVHRDHAFAIVLEPLAPDRTREHIALYYAAPQTDEPLRQKNAAMWRTVFEEDIGVVEGMQRGRQGGLFDGGRFAPGMDGPVHVFHRWIADQLSA